MSEACWRAAFRCEGGGGAASAPMVGEEERRRRFRGGGLIFVESCGIVRMLRCWAGFTWIHV